MASGPHEQSPPLAAEVDGGTVLRVAIVDSDEQARARLHAWLSRNQDIHIVGEAGTLEEAADLLRETGPDLVVAETEISGPDTLQLIDLLEGAGSSLLFFPYGTRSAVGVREGDPGLHEKILRLAHQSKSVSGPGEVAESSPRVNGQRTGERLHWLSVPVGDRYILIHTRDIRFIEGAGNYVRIHTESRSVLFRSTLSSLEERLDPSMFARIHRSTIVNVEMVGEIFAEGGGDFIVALTTGERLRMSRNYRRSLLG